MIHSYTKWMTTVVQLCLIAGGASSFAEDRKIYVANEGADTVSVIDGKSFLATRSIAVGVGAHNLQISPDGKRVWVTNNGAPSTAPEQAAHKAMPMAEHGSMAANGEVWTIDTTTDKVVSKIVVGKHPAHVVLTNDGQFAYVTNGGDNTVSVVDVQAAKLVGTIATGEFPHGIRMSPDGKQAYVANLKGGTVSVIDIDRRKEIDQIVVGKGPAQVGFTPDGRYAFVSLSQENRVAVIDPVSRKVLQIVDVGTVPIQIYATPNSRVLIVANQGTRKLPGKSISLIDLSNFKVVKTIATGMGAHGVAVGADGQYAYVTNLYSNSVSVIDLKLGKGIRTVAVGKAPNGITVAP